jgi:hypothetical protein
VNLDSLTWTCHICGEERPDRFISVRSKSAIDRVTGIRMTENIRYCNDKPSCWEGTENFSFIRRENHLSNKSTILEKPPAPDAEILDEVWKRYLLVYGLVAGICALLIVWSWAH